MMEDESRFNEHGYLTELPWDAEIFYYGSDAHKAGWSEDDCPKVFSEISAAWWLAGFQSAERKRLNPDILTDLDDYTEYKHGPGMMEEERRFNEHGYLTELPYSVDIFYYGIDAHKAGWSEDDCPKVFSLRGAAWWLAGFQSAERKRLNPGMPMEEYEQIQTDAEAAYHLDVANGTVTPCPYHYEDDRSLIWGVRYTDCQAIYGGIEDDDWEVIGAPRAVQHVANPDGTHTYSVADISQKSQ